MEIKVPAHLDYMFSGKLFAWLNGKIEFESKEEFFYLIRLMFGTVPQMTKCIIEEIDYLTGEPIDFMRQLIECGFYESKSEMYRLIKDNAMRINGQVVKKDSTIDDFIPRPIPDLERVNLYVLKSGKKDFDIFFLMRD